MVQFPASGFASEIVKIVQKRPISTQALLGLLNQNGVVTAQGMYKALRILRRQGIVLVHKSEVVLNQAWLRQLGKFTALAEHAYKSPVSDSGNFLQLRDGDRITYEFRDPVQVDIFWNHVLYVLFDALPKIKRWYAYASHCWFLIARRKDELALREYMQSKGVMCLFTVAHSTPLDRSVKKDFDGVHAQYHMRAEPLFLRRANAQGIVLNIFGDYIIEAQYDRVTTQNIEKFYEQNASLNSDNQKQLEEIVSSPSRVKFVITRNATRATKLTKQFEKHFYFPR